MLDAGRALSSCVEWFDVLEEAAGTEELRERLPVLVAGEPLLAAVRCVQLGVVPQQHPDRVGLAALRGADLALGSGVGFGEEIHPVTVATGDLVSFRGP